jgi:HD-like signal output (HDOD) protein
MIVKMLTHMHMDVHSVVLAYLRRRWKFER